MTGSATETTPPDPARRIAVDAVDAKNATPAGISAPGAIAAFVAAHLVDRVLQGAGSGETLLWLAPAVLAAALHRLAPSSRPQVAVAALAVQLAGWLPAPLPGDPSPLVGAALALAGTGAAIIGCVLLDRAVATRADVGEAHHVRRMATIVVPAVAATMAAAAGIAIHAGAAVSAATVGDAHAGGVSLPARFAVHLAAALAGALAGIPVVLAHTGGTQSPRREPDGATTIGTRLAAAGAALFATWLALAGSAPPLLAPFGFGVAAILPWTAHRCGAKDATLIAVVAAIEAAALTALDPTGDAVRNAAGGLLVGAASVAGIALLAARRATQPTEREIAAQRETAERAIFLDHVVAASGATWFDWEPATGVARYDDRWPELLGYAPGEIAPTTAAWEALVHPDDVAAGRAALEACLRGGDRFEFTGRFRAKSRAWRSILCRGIASRAGDTGAVRIVGTHTDVTQVGELGESERTSAARFRAAMDGSLDAFFLLEPVRTPAGRIEDFVVAHTNRLGAELLGRTEDEVTGRSLAELAPVMKLLGIIDRYGRALAAEETLVDELHIDSPQIRAQHIRQQAVPVGDALAVTIHDSTEHRRLQKALIQAQKMEGLGRLAGGVAHDFNNLLTVIRGYSEMAALALPENDPSRENVQVIIDAADRAADITGRLLTFARRSASETRRVDANDIVGELDRLLMRLIGEDVRLVIEKAPDPAWIEIDPGSLEQVLVNLAANARDAMPSGGTLTIRIAHVEITEAASTEIPESRPGRFVRIEVADDGAGMSQEVLAHLFEPFFTTKTTGKGTGLGLATSYGVVKQADGFIHVASEEGRGTRVTLHLPRAEEPQAQTAPIELDATALGGGETVLVVEDEPAVRNFIAEALRTGGYEVIEAADGAAAIDASRGRAGPIHVLVSDVVMPDLRGPDIAATLCAERTGLRVLYVSGYTADAFEGLGSGDGGPALLRKPFTIMQLLMMVRQVLDTDPTRTPI